MRNLIRFFFLFYGIIGYTSSVKAQIVNIPNPHFKISLISSGVDTNGDGEIQVTEAQAINGLQINAKQISDITGIEAFVNLVYLQCDANRITNLDVSKLTALTDLDCSYNQLSQLNIANNTALSVLNCNYNQLTGLDISNNLNLTDLSCGNNQLTNLDISHNANITKLHCGNNLLTNLVTSNHLNLGFLSCSNNLLTNLDVSNACPNKFHTKKILSL